MSRPDYVLRHNILGLCRSCPRQLAESSKVFCEIHLEKSRVSRKDRDKRLNLKLKADCFKHYGGKCHCCGEALMKFLTLDHINGKGNIHRKTLFKYNVGGFHMYRWLKKNNYPAGYTILCMNCNWATRYGNVCPHKLGGIA